MDSALFEHQGALLVDMSRPATAQRAFECGALFGSESPQLSANLAECLRTRLLEVTRRNRRSSGATTTTAPVAPALDATEALAWFAEAMRRGVQDDAVIVRGAALAALNWDEARAQDWAATGIVHGADPVQLWQTVVLAGVTCGRHDAADMGLQALAQSIPGDPRLAPLTILFEKGVTNETAGNLDIHQLRELARICAEVGSVEGLAPVATALLKQDPNDVEIRELYAEALETALLGSPGAPSCPCEALGTLVGARIDDRAVRTARAARRAIRALRVGRPGHPSMRATRRETRALLRIPAQEQPGSPRSRAHRPLP